MKGDTVRFNGDLWTVVDVAPAEPLAEMVAAILEEENFTVVVRGFGLLSDVLNTLGIVSSETTLVLVPQGQGEAAMALIAETVTDFEGDELEAFLADFDTKTVDPDADPNDTDDIDDADDTDDTDDLNAGRDR